MMYGVTGFSLSAVWLHPLSGPFLSLSGFISLRFIVFFSYDLIIVTSYDDCYFSFLFLTPLFFLEFLFLFFSFHSLYLSPPSISNLDFRLTVHDRSLIPFSFNPPTPAVWVSMSRYVALSGGPVGWRRPISHLSVFLYVYPSAGSIILAV